MRKRFGKALACSFVVTVSAVSGCAVEPESESPAPSDQQPEARGRAGKADLPGTCHENQCGGKGSGQCWCDDKCVEYGDCCSNVLAVCDVGAECAQDADCEDGFCGYDEDQARVCKPWGQIGDSCEGFVMPSYYTKCDPSLVCKHPEPTGDVPGTCMPANCDPTLICGQAISCVNGKSYPTTCGPANCDEPLGPCHTVNPPPPPAPTCEGSCGGAAPGKVCFCDSVCTSFGDCCSDYEAVCQ